MKPEERMVRSKDGGYYLMRIIPYMTIENIVDGVVITFTDVTQIKKQEADLEKLEAMEAALGHAEAIIETLRDPFIVLDPSLRVVSANGAFYKYFQMSAAEVKGRFLYELDQRQWDIPELRGMLDDVLSGDKDFENFEVQLSFGKIGKRRMFLNARQIRHEGVPQALILLAMEEAINES
jgi:two-component system, chemotaxis family, CheB/CheR fusion protein